MIHCKILIKTVRGIKKSLSRSTKVRSHQKKDNRTYIVPTKLVEGELPVDLTEKQKEKTEVKSFQTDTHRTILKDTQIG